MAKTKLTYTAKGEKKRTETFRTMAEAREHLAKLESVLIIMSAEVKEVEIRESALAYLGRSGGTNAA